MNEAAANRKDTDGFVGLTTGKALSILLGCVGALAAGFLFLVVHVWDGISDDIKELRSTSHADAAATHATLLAQSEAAGEFKAFVQNQLPELTKQIAASTAAIATLNASVEETRRQVTALSQTVEKLRDSVVLKKTDYTVEQFDFSKQRPGANKFPLYLGYSQCPFWADRAGLCPKPDSNIQ